MKKQKNLILVVIILSLLMTYSYKTRSQQMNTFIDTRDNSIYKTVTLGNQIWMAENLHFKTSKDCWYYKNDSINCKKFGRLYTWEMAKEACPVGWHLPSKAEFDTLIKFLGGDSVAGAKIKSNSFLETQTRFAYKLSIYRY